MATNDPELRDHLSHLARMRPITCRKCGTVGLERLDGSKCGGLAGIEYKVCGSCGNAQAITKRQKRERL